MTETASMFPELEPERQTPLPGLEGLAPVQPPLMAEVRDDPDPDPVRARPGPGQLSLGANQMELEPVPEGPVQLALLDEPHVWEESGVVSPPKPKGGRLHRKRTRAGIIPGQGALFR